MSPFAGEIVCGLLLKGLVSDADALIRQVRSFRGDEWRRLADLARANVVLLRLANRLGVLDEGPIEPVFVRAVAEERARIARTIELIRVLSDLCHAARIAHVFTKAFQHYPDMGHDVDLFVADRSDAVDRLVCAQLGGRRAQGSLLNWIAGKSAYDVPGYPSPVEIHHGRIGHLGEHNRFPHRLLANRRTIRVEQVAVDVPGPEERLLLQVIQRIYGHLSIRLSDVVQSLELLRGGELDWDSVVRTSREIGIFDGLRCYLTYLRQIAEMSGVEVGMPAMIETLASNSRWGRVRWTGFVYRFPSVLVAGRAYLKKFLSDVTVGNWEGAGRLALLPPLSVMLGCRLMVLRAKGQ